VFGEAGWDTLLAIYVFAAAGRTLSAGELASATTETSLTSALRLQRRLVDVGLVRRIAHPSDRRRVLVELTAEGQIVLEDYLDHLLDNRLSLANEDYFDHPRLLSEICRKVAGR
jgi:DNA-binding MarR family transcriptional regulator